MERQVGEGVQLRVFTRSDRPLMDLFYAKCEMLLVEVKAFGCITGTKQQKSCQIWGNGQKEDCRETHVSGCREGKGV